MKKKKGRLGLSNSFHYTLMVLPGYIWLFMFSIVPMVGIVMAFQDYNPSKGWFGSPWVGMKWFKYLTVIPDAKRALVNTLIIAIAKVILNIIIPLVFALLLNEVKNMKFKKTVQTIVYLPHFVSWVILANIITNILGANGIFNTVRCIRCNGYGSSNDDSWHLPSVTDRNRCMERIRLQRSYLSGSPDRHQPESL